MAIEIKGKWKKGFVLDLHTKSSTFLGTDALGHDQFDTERTEIGQFVYDLKYGNDRTVIPKIIEIIIKQITGFDKMNVIIPIPPSKTRENQPVQLIADALGTKLGIPVIKHEVVKIKATPELKNIVNPIEREEILGDAFSLEGKYNLNGKSVLLIDDLYRSGSTLRAITGILYDNGNVENVYVIALTKTRSNR